jgi:hypothetical protein
MTPLLALLPVALLPAAHAGGIPALSGVISVEARDPVGPSSTPAVLLSAPDRAVAWAIECTTGDESVKTHTGAIPAGEVHVVSLPRDESVTTASCAVLGTFANGLAERRQVELSWTFFVPPPEGEAAKDGATPPPSP